MPSDGAAATTSSFSGADVAALIDTAQPFLRGELCYAGDPKFLTTLAAAGAGECWHKHGSFLDHLVGVYRILRIWGAHSDVALCGLYHSAYSNSYVNLAIFDAAASRGDVARIIGAAAERLVYLFCVVPRQPLIHDELLFRYSDDGELRDHLRASELHLAVFREKGVRQPEHTVPWRAKLNAVIPADGLVVKHIKTGEDLRVSRKVVAAFLLMTMADFSDQLFGFQDELFRNENGRLEFSGNNPAALWPGDGKPGLWMNSISRMAAIYALIAREEEISARDVAGIENRHHDDALISDLVIPPVFDWCTRILDAGEQREARDLYWQVVTGAGAGAEEELLRRSAEKNPFVGEPRVVLAQVLMASERFEEAEGAAEEGLRLILGWGSSWDKRMTWQGWVAWTRVLLTKAREREWPKSAWGIINLGLVR